MEKFFKELESRFLTTNNLLGVPQQFTATKRRRHSEVVLNGSQINTNIGKENKNGNTLNSSHALKLKMQRRRHSYQPPGQKNKISGRNSLLFPEDKVILNGSTLEKIFQIFLADFSCGLLLRTILADFSCEQFLRTLLADNFCGLFYRTIIKAFL